jgi:hypothetical protein
LNLLSQQLAGLKGEEIYQLTSCLNAEEREFIGVLRAIQVLPGIDVATAKKCEELIPFFLEIGKSKWPRTELTDLGLRVGNRFRGTISASAIEENEVVTDDSDTTG